MPYGMYQDITTPDQSHVLIGVFARLFMFPDATLALLAIYLLIFLAFLSKV